MNSSSKTQPRLYKHLDTITALFVATLLVSNIVSSKIISLGSFTFAGGIIVFPLSYIFGDILTEVYGYRRSRKVIWPGAWFGNTSRVRDAFDLLPNFIRDFKSA